VLLVIGSGLLYARSKNLWTLLQLVGAASLAGVAVAHVCEAWRPFPGHGWGQEVNPGHYLDLSCALLGLTAFPLGYLIAALKSRDSR